MGIDSLDPALAISASLPANGIGNGLYPPLLLPIYGEILISLGGEAWEGYLCPLGTILKGRRQAD